MNKQSGVLVIQIPSKHFRIFLYRGRDSEGDDASWATVRDNSLDNSVLWAYRTAEKVTMLPTPYFLTYGISPILPIEFQVPTLRTVETQRLNEEESQLEHRYHLTAFEEQRDQAEEWTEHIQAYRKQQHDKKIRHLDVSPGDLVLLYDSRFQKFPGKLHLQWMGPYVPKEVFPNGSVQLEYLDGSPFHLRVNGWRVRKYHE